MQQLTRRQCNSEKDCSKCGREIAKGEYYYNNPNISLCEGCNEIEKNKQPVEKKESNIISEDYIVSGTCDYCSKPARGIWEGKKHCGIHYDKAVEDTV